MENPDKLIDKLHGKYEFTSDSTQFRTRIEERILQGKPTIIKLTDGNGPNAQTHFAVVSGARYNANGEVTHYILSDPGARDSNIARINVRDLSYVKDPTRYIVRVIMFDK